MTLRLWILLFAVGIEARIENMNAIDTEEPNLNRSSESNFHKPSPTDIKSYKLVYIKELCIEY